MTARFRRLLAVVLVAIVTSPGTLHAHDAGMGLVRYQPDGRLDQGFGRAGIVAERTAQGGLTPEALVLQADGKTVLIGTASDLATAAVGFGVSRYNPDGTLDSSYGGAGRVLTRVGAATSEAHAAVLQPDGDILVAGGAFPDAKDAVSNFAVARYTPAGSLDPGFGGTGLVLTPIGQSGAEARAIALQPDGRIVVAGTAFASGATNDVLAVARYNTDGSLDPRFGSGGSVVTTFAASAADGGSSPIRAAALVVQADGKLVAVGSIGGHQAAFALARYLPTGELDPTFGASGDGKTTTQSQVSAQAYAAAVQPDGNIVVAGGLGATTESVAFGLARYLPTGDLDPSFGTGGFATTGFAGGGSGAHALSIQTDGKIVAIGSGYASPAAGQAGQAAVTGGFAVVRYLPDGALDPSFGTGGVVLTTVGDAGSMPSAVGIQGDGTVVAAGITYFLVPTPSDDRVPVYLAVAVSALVVLLAAAILVRRVFKTKKAGRARIRPGPAA